MDYRKGVFIVVYSREDNLKYLLLERKLHWKGWEFPKGGIEKSEPLLKSVKREVKEETGLNPKNIINHKITGKYKYSKKIPERKENGQTYTLFSCEVKNNKIKIDKKEHSNYKWVSFEKAIKMLTWPNQRKCLRIVNKFLNKK